MKRLVLFAAVLSLSTVALQLFADEPGIIQDPRPTDLTSKRPGTNDEPTIRPDPRPLDLSTPKQATGRSAVDFDVEGLTLEQSDRIRAIRARAEIDVQAIRDRERAEILMVLNEQQRVDFLNREGASKVELRRPAALPTTRISPSPLVGEGRGEG